MPNETSEHFALAAKYFLKEYKEKGGSQASLAKELGVTSAYISSVVNGSRAASFDLYTQIAKKLYGPLDQFLAVGRRIKDGLPPLPDHQNGHEDEAEHLITRLAYYILDHRRIAKEIKELKQFYESIVENLQSAILVMDNKNEVIFTNKQIKQICGILPDEVIGKSPYEFEKTIAGLRIHPFVRKYDKAFKSLKPLFYDNIQFITQHSPARYISGWLIPLVNENGGYDGMICTLRDTTESYAMHNLLVETVEHIQDAVVILQQTEPGEIPIAFFANKKFRKIFGFNEVNPFSDPFDELVDIIKKNIINKAEWEDFITKAIKDNQSTTTFVFELNNGQKYFASGNPIHDSAGAQIGRMATLKKII